MSGYPEDVNFAGTRGTLRIGKIQNCKIAKFKIQNAKLQNGIELEN